MESGRFVNPSGPRPVPIAPEETKITLRPSARSATISSSSRRIVAKSGFRPSSRSDRVPALTTTRRALFRKSRDMAAHHIRARKRSQPVPRRRGAPDSCPGILRASEAPGRYISRMAGPSAAEVVHERLKAFLVFLKPRLLQENVDGVRLDQLRRLSDVRVRKFAVTKP